MAELHAMSIKFIVSFNLIGYRGIPLGGAEKMRGIGWVNDGEWIKDNR